MEWDPKIGPATVVGVIGSLGILVSLGIVWGSSKSQLDALVDSLAVVKTTQGKFWEVTSSMEKKIDTVVTSQGIMQSQYVNQVQHRDGQVNDIKNVLTDHEGRIRTLERPHQP